MSVGSAADAAAAAAAAKAGEKVVIEIWTLYAIAVLVVVLRTYARIVAVGVSKLRADDYLVWVGLVGVADFRIVKRSLLTTNISSCSIPLSRL